MAKTNQQIFLIDFDSTFIKSEGLDELAATALQKNSNKKETLEKIKLLTQQGMDGKIPFGKSLKDRLNLLRANRTHVEKTAKLLKKNISSSILRNKSFFKTYADNIYIISGGFKELVLPVVKPFGIKENHVFANTFIFDKNDNIVGIDKKNPLSQNDGKVKLLRSLKLKGEITEIGDGYTDYKLKEAGLVDHFIAFTENIEREIVTKKADQVAASFDEFLFINNLPMSLSYPKNRISVLMLENVSQTAVAAFEKEGYEVSWYTKSLPEEELLEKVKNASVLCVRSRTAVTPKVVEHAQRLLSVGTFTIGTNHLHLPSLTQKGIAAFYAPYSSTRSVVELVIGEMIMLIRNVFEKSTKMHQGIWDKSAGGSHEVKGKKLGIIGYGNIGTQVGLIAEALGMHVYFYDTVEKPVLGNAIKCDTLDELLKKSDVVTVHVDGNQKNTNLISEKEFHHMKNGIFFINASRGFVVDQQALIKYLQLGKIKGAAIDVFPKEPKANGDPFLSQLQNLPNVILTPHIGGSTEEAQGNIAQFVSNKIIEYINSGSTYLSINLPNIQTPEQNHAHRFLHMHKNVPGVLAQINSVLAENNINVLGQYLKTNEDLGYVVTDVNKKHEGEVLNILKHIPDTIRFRVLY
jgi:D-3-phosphoglycerate dehydrogenase / 2-oxoglutarate reductase